MTLIVADRVKETTTTTGTGALTLAGAMTGYRAFSSVCTTGDTLHYALQAVDGTGQPTGDWEVGFGTYSGANTLTRTTVLSSSNSGSAVSLAAGTKQVWIDIAASDYRNARNRDTPPILTNFSWVNQGGATATQETFGITMKAPSSAGASMRMLTISAPGTPYRIAARIKYVLQAKNYHNAGVLWRDSASGKVHTFGPSFATPNSTAYHTWRLIRWDSATVYNSDDTPATIGVLQSPEWISIRDDGTNRICELSSDGVTWVQLFSVTRTTFITPDQVGFFVEAENNATPNLESMLTVYSWLAT